MKKAIRQFVFLLVLITALPQVTNAGILSALGLKSLVPVITLMQPTPPGLPSAPCRTYSVYVTHKPIGVACNNVNYVVNHGGSQISANLDQSVAPNTSGYTYNSFHWKKLATGVITDASGQFTVRMRPSNTATSCVAGDIYADAILIVDDLGRKYVIDDLSGNAVVASGTGAWSTDTNAANYSGEAKFISKTTAILGNYYFDWTFDEANYFTDSDNDGIYDDCDLDDDNDGILDVDEITLGKIANPFTSLEQARANVFKAGRYYFNLSGNKFSTYVNEAGYVLVAVDYGDGVGALATSTKLGLTKATYGRGILNSTTLAALGTVAELRISTNSTSAGGVDVTTSNSTLINRVKANQSLHNGVVDNAINENWSGVNQIYLRRNATGSPAVTNLNNNVVHVAGNSGSFNWIPEFSNQRVQWSSGEIANEEYLALWVRGNTSGVTEDTDNDDTPNHLDLDSDDDGCSDAYEAGATTDTTTDYEFAATPDANSNGLNDDVENGTTGNINYTSTYAHYGLNDAIKACLDSDGDNVPDLIDLDDDNDGVTDKTECFDVHTLDMGAFDGLEALAGTGAVGYATLPGTNTTVKLTLVSNGNSGSISAKASGGLFASRDPSGDGSLIQIGTMFINNTQESYVLFEFEEPVYNLNFTVTDIDGGNSSRPERAYIEASLNDDIYIPEASLVANGPMPTQTGTLFIGDSGAGGLNSNVMKVSYQDAVNKLKLRVTGSNANDVQLTISLFNLNYTVCPDTDGDGTTNELDLDSDDDDCSDAYEAGATSDTTTDYQFPSTPDANGNGLNDNVEVGTTGKTNYLSTYEHYALNDAIKACLDTDADGVPDLIDIDDDNDGVLDIVESGCGTADTPFTSLSQARSVPHSGRYYFDLGSGVFQADVDANEGGGWVLVAQYVHKGGTNPALTVLGAGDDFPATSTSALGIDESANADKWGHAGNAALNQFSGDFEVRFYGETNAHTRKIHFKTSLGTEYLKTGTGSFTGLATSNVLLSGHTANLPAAANLYYSNQGDIALTNFPFYRHGTYHWGISGAGTRWEVDVPVSGSTYNTIHKVWIRSTIIESCNGVDTDGDGTPNHLDLDSDDDGCSDAFEAGATTNTTTDYQYPSTPDVNGNGLNDNVEVGTSGNVVYAHTSTYAAYALNDDFKLCVDTDGDSVADIYDIDDDNDATPDNMECKGVPTVFDWSQNTWAATAMSNTYDVLGNTFNFTVTDASGALLPDDSVPVAASFYQGGLSSVDDQLIIVALIDKLGTSNVITTAIDMGVSGIGLENVSFKLFDVDGNTTSTKMYQEELTVRGYLNGVEVAPALIGNSGYQRISGNVINGLIEAPTTGGSSGNGTVEVYFAQAVDRVEIDFGIAVGGQINGSSPGFGIYDIVFFSDCDKDGDGTPNRLDLDSDGDGCSDAYEAGATTDLSTDYQFTATPDANGNGLNDNVENGSSDQINYTSTYGDFALYAALKACEDSDGDSVFNGIDLDDDNDGVLDTDEGSDCILTYSFSGTLDGSRDRGAANNDQNRDFVFGDNYAFNLDFDCEIGIEISTTFGDASGSRTGIITVGGSAKSFSTGVNEFKTVTHVPAISDSYSVQVSGADVTMTQMTVTDAFGNVLAQFDFGTPSSPVAAGYIGVDETLTSGTVAVSPITVDTDGDGTFNLLDLDSDDDGCSDAYEGGATNDLTSDYQFAASPDINSNGLNDTVEDGTTGNINYTLTYDTYALNDELQLCDCQFLWLKADAGTLNGASAATDGQAVNTWQDQTAWRTNDATDANTLAPTFRDNVSDYINYNPVVEFDGLNDALGFGDDYLFSEREGVTYLAVVMPDVTAATKNYQFVFDFGTVSGHGYGMVQSSFNARVYTPSGHGGIESSIFHTRDDQVTLSRMRVEFGGLQTLTFDAGGTNEVSTSNTLVGLGATQIAENATPTSGAGPFTIGSQSKLANITSNDGRYFDGKIAEIIGFCNPLTPSQLSRFESYLAVKWGITQDNSDGGEYGDYVDHDGTVVWDASEYAAHHYNVAGIGRDDAISLNQKQSKSVNADAILSIGLDANTDGLESSNAGNTSTFSSDKSYMLWGHDNEPFGDRHIKEFDPLQVNSRLNREWRATKTGDIGTVTLEFDVTSLPGPTGVGTNDESQIVLLLDADGDFSAGATVVTQSYVVASDGLVKFSANIPDGAYFTLASSEENALPITLVNFEVRQTEDGAVELYWTTASEVNNSHFVIERSTDGYGFSEIGFKTGAVNSTELVEYQYFDLQPPAGRAYYRLKQVDINGAYEYSPVRSINITGEQQFNVVVYPNPVHSGQDLVLEFNEARIEGRAELEVFGVNSTSVYKSTFEFKEGDNKNVVVPTNGFSQGLYIVAVSWNNGSKRIFKRVVVH